MPTRTKTTNKRASRKKAEICDEESIDTIADALAHNWKTNFVIKKPFYFTENHLKFKDALLNVDNKISFVDGPAGTAKSYIAVLCALEMLKAQKIDNILYIRSVIESASRSIGALPGEVDDKFLPYAMPLMEKVAEICGQGVANQLKGAGLLNAIPVNFVRGLTFNNTFVIIDEAQNLTRSELVTILTRFGKDTHYAVCGDLKQSDIGKLSGYKDIYERFEARPESAENGITTVKFGDKDIVRSKILRYIVDVLET